MQVTLIISIDNNTIDANTSIYGIRYLYINICKHTYVNISSRSDGVGPARIQIEDSIRYCVHFFSMISPIFVIPVHRQVTYCQPIQSQTANVIIKKKFVRGWVFSNMREIYNVRCLQIYAYYWVIVIKEKTFAEKFYNVQSYICAFD